MATDDDAPKRIEPDPTPYDPAAYPAVRRLLRRLSGTELQSLKVTDIPDAQRRLPTRVVELCPCDIKEG